MSVIKNKNILITSPSLEAQKNISGISSVTQFIISNNQTCNYTVFKLGRNDNEKRNLVWLFGLAKTALQWTKAVISKQNKYVHFNFAFSKASAIRDAPLILLAKLLRKKMVVHLHGGEYLTQQMPPRWMRFVLSNSLPSKKPVIVLSPIEKKAVEEKYGMCNVFVLPNCVDVVEAKKFRRTSRLQGQPLNLLFIGRISTSKGIAHIYNGLKILKQKNIAFNFFMAGTGPDEEEFKEKFTTVLGSNFFFEGVVFGSQKTALLKKCDVFLLPSLFEGLPMSLLETMSFGLVPLVTNVGSIKYVVTNNENGVMLGENPAEEIAVAVENLINSNELIKRLSDASAITIFNSYDPEIYIDKLNKIYEAANAS
jgi:glycosyltransferase involved in cell wall biosynthesis